MFKKLNQKFDANQSTGFGTNSSQNAGRYFSAKTGMANVQLRGNNWFSRISLYHFLLGLNWAKFLLLIFSFYIFINILFACLYLLIGLNNLNGINSNHQISNFSEAFFFSTQTFTTVGYGRVSPDGYWANSISTFEAFIGLLSFSIITSLFYGRFVKPRAFLKFSKIALISPYKNGRGFMFRMAPFKKTQLSDGEIKLTLAMQTNEEGIIQNRFYNLKTEISKVNIIALSWTVVHNIDEESPLYEMYKEDFVNAKLEIMIFLKAFDEEYSNTVLARYSYIASEIVWGAKFKIMYQPNEFKTATVLDLSLLDVYEKVELPNPVVEALLK